MAPSSAGSLFHAARAAGWTDGDEAPAKRPQSHQGRPKQPEAPKPPPHDPRALWGACAPATAEHPYIIKKLGLPDGLRVYHGPLTIAGKPAPVRWCCRARLWPAIWRACNSLYQTDGKKLFLPGCKLPPDACLIVGGPIKEGDVYIVEGVGQAWSAHQATRAPACSGGFRSRPHASVTKDRCASDTLPPGWWWWPTPARKTNAPPSPRASVMPNGLKCPQGSPSNFDLNDFHQGEGPQGRGQPAGWRQGPAFAIRSGTAHRRSSIRRGATARQLAGSWSLSAWRVLSHRIATECRQELSFSRHGRKGGQATTAELDYSFGAAVVAHGRAVYVSAEDDEPEIHRRLWSLCGGVMPDRLLVLSLPDVGHFGIIEADRTTKEFKPTEAWRDLVTEIRELPDVKLIVLDTLQALTTGDTNTVEATQPLMNEATALASATGACVLLVHHVAKGSTPGNPDGT
jgi:hypothetical protein